MKMRALLFSALAAALSLGPASAKPPASPRLAEKAKTSKAPKKPEEAKTPREPRTLATQRDTLAKVIKDMERVEASFSKKLRNGTTSSLEDGHLRALNRARFLIGEISREEFLQRSDELTERKRGMLEQQNKIGAGVGEEGLIALANAVIADYSLKPLE